MRGAGRTLITRTANVSMWALVPLLIAYRHIVEAQSSLIHNADYEFYCDSVAIALTGGNVFRAALRKVVEMQMAERLLEQLLRQDDSATLSPQEQMSNDEAHEIYLAEFDRQLRLIRTSDAVLRRPGAAEGSSTHPSLIARLEKATSGDVSDDLSEPLYRGRDVPRQWRQLPVTRPAPRAAADDLAVDSTRGAFGVCHFCGSRITGGADSISVVLHGNVREVQVHESMDITRTIWDSRTVRVPRCARCGKAHRAVQSATALGAGIAMGLAIAFAGSSVWWGRYTYSTGGAFLYFGIAETIILIASVMILGAVVRAFLFRTAGEDTKHELSTIQRYRQQGWKLGKSPYGQRAIPKVGQRPKPRLEVISLGDAELFRRYILNERRSLFLRMSVIWLPVVVVVTLVPLLWLFTVRTTEAALDLFRLGVLHQPDLVERLLVANVDPDRPANDRANAFKEADRLLASMSAASTSTLENLGKIAYGPAPAVALRSHELLASIAPDVAIETDIHALGSSDPSLRERAAVYLRSFGPAARAATVSLLAATQDPVQLFASWQRGH